MLMFLDEDTKYINGGNDTTAVKYLDEMLIEEGIDYSDSNYFPEDEGGSIEIVVEMETAYAALCMDMMKIEHRAVINEDMEILEEAEKGFWEKVGDFFKKMWGHIKARFNKIMSFFTSKFMDAEKWFEKNKDKMAESGEVKAYKLLVEGDPMPEVISKIKNIVKATTTDDIKTLKDDAIKTLKESVKEKEKFKVKRDELGAIIKGLSKYKEFVKNNNSEQAAEIKKVIEKAERAKTGDKEKDKTNEELNKKSVEVAKARLAAFSSIESRQISVCKAALSSAISACRQLMSKTKED